MMVPPKPGVDTSVAPRRLLGVTLQLAFVLVVGVPLVAFTQPFVPGAFGAVTVAGLVAVLAVSFWRSAQNLQQHVRAGAEVIVGAIRSRSRESVPVEVEPLHEVEQMLPGLGDLVAVPLAAGSAAVGQTLAQLNLRGRTGATVLAITRPEGPVLAPGAQERLRSGDVLALAGTAEAIAAAKARLSGS
jgi:CPA2 family monovalent cation:H+ antiporter-2